MRVSSIVALVLVICGCSGPIETQENIDFPEYLYFRGDSIEIPKETKTLSQVFRYYIDGDSLMSTAKGFDSENRHLLSLDDRALFLVRYDKMGRKVEDHYVLFNSAGLREFKINYEYGDTLRRVKRCLKCGASEPRKVSITFDQQRRRLAYRSFNEGDTLIESINYEYFANEIATYCISKKVWYYKEVLKVDTFLLKPEPFHDDTYSSLYESQQDLTEIVRDDRGRIVERTSASLHETLDFGKYDTLFYRTDFRYNQLDSILMELNYIQFYPPEYQLENYTVFNYQDKGKLSGKNTFNSDSTLIAQTTYTYRGGRLSLEIHQDFNSPSANYEKLFEYDTQGRITTLVQLVDREKVKKVVWYYR